MKTVSIHFTKQIFTLGLLAIIFAINVSKFASAYPPIRTRYLDKKCNVNFSYTELYDDESKTSPNSQLSRKNYNKCYNDTLFDTGLNHAVVEKSNCLMKCLQIAIGVANHDGTLNSKLPDLIKEQYKKYSNATTDYIDKVTGMYARCVDEASNKLKLLQANETIIIGDCEINGLYEDCWSDLRMRHYKSNTTKELCGR